MFNPLEWQIRIITDQVEKAGYLLTESQLQHLRVQLSEQENSDNFDIDIPGIDDDIIINFSQEEELEIIVQQIENSIPSLLNESVDIASEELTSSLKKDAPRMLKQHKRIELNFQKKIASIWGKSLDLLETLLVIAVEAGDNINDCLRDEASKNQDYVFDVVARLHARSCQIGYEILTLLRAGYADGAHARWRSLHELIVVAYYISDQGQETAKRYLLHEVVDRNKATKMYQEHFLALGVLPVDEKELEDLKQSEKDVITEVAFDDNDAKFYKKEYGWASSEEHRDPKFVDIAKKSGFLHMSPYYKWASHNIHAGPMRFHTSLGLLGIEDDVLSTGPSTQGLTIPGHSTAVAIMQITTLFLNFENTVDNVALCKVLDTFSEDIGKLFIEAEKLTLN
ncbi:DUF5677 domain-containing protein [Fibrella aquatilis]|uniref:Uncharacterized protein n=1 Tax=Fibrella aquatilis TaxID=2817059 RepID=A0A939G3V6_9BACT|nr:DUF5677 domain-containing protein [Fibrella aquatilis]MBO0931872.1 hypothetical protein [Fibrella aquatilis]